MQPRILVSLWPGIGDIMFSTPAIRHLRREFPEAYIAAISLDGGPGKELLETNPYLDEIFFAGKGGVYSPACIKEALDWAKSRRFEVGLELSFPVQWFFRLAGLKEVYSFGRRAFWWLVPYREKEGREIHASEHFLKVVEKLRGRPLERDGKGYDLVLTDEDRSKAASLFGGLSGERVVVVHPGARCNLNKRWSVEKFVELGRRLMGEARVTLLIVGGPEDAELGGRIAAELKGRALNLAGRTTLRETAAIVERADLFVGNDSGPLHVAASTATPIVAIFGSSNPKNFAPPNHRVTVVQPPDPCVPCLHFPGYMWFPWGLRLRYYNKCRAMEGLGVETVFQACMEVLG